MSRFRFTVGTQVSRVRVCELRTSATVLSVRLMSPVPSQDAGVAEEMCKVVHGLDVHGPRTRAPRWTGVSANRGASLAA